MKKNGLAVEMIPVHTWDGYIDRSGRNTEMLEYREGDVWFETYVESAEYFELFEKYRKMKRTVARMKRRNRKKMLPKEDV